MMKDKQERSEPVMMEEHKPEGSGPEGPPGATEKPREGEDPAAALEKARAEIAALQEKAAKAEEYLDLARRAKADFVNYQDRVRRERQEWTRQAVEQFVREFLSAMDAFPLARFDDPKLVEAIRVIEREFLRILAKFEVVPMETAGKTFDPLYHEAVAVEERADVPEGTILEEVRRGWKIGDRVLRPASVRIARRPPPQNRASEGAAPAGESR
jgi:molecular chaperone GrpE